MKIITDQELCEKLDMNYLTEADCRYFLRTHKDYKNLIDIVIKKFDLKSAYSAENIIIENIMFSDQGTDIIIED